MAFRSRMTAFARDESGAVTVDWVVLTAAIIFMGIAAGFTVTSSVPSLADKASSVVANRPVGAN
ncbi:hypothetical protein [Maritimibacter sp. DP1N21-5]|uniref:hypothetical protein n=1 Tax=Maritimibacter sp. DP1N21-5 TaxID=2836867 RepID=UPI001C46B397|nr:hypothetical protein [Maritimibacter sp. DP1N21-5]MBV7410561.1 hypothetical protein [Maritimibacter sp. DP1N21-5]